MLSESETGTIYANNLTATGLGNVTQVSNMTTRFPSGVQSLMDFNPVVNALRLIGSETLQLRGRQFGRKSERNGDPKLPYLRSE
jgi:hypothetical protein